MGWGRVYQYCLWESNIVGEPAPTGIMANNNNRLAIAYYWQVVNNTRRLKTTMNLVHFNEMAFKKSESLQIKPCAGLRNKGEIVTRIRY